MAEPIGQLGLTDVIDSADTRGSVIGFPKMAQFRPLITHVTTLDDVVEDGFERLLTGKNDVKVVVKVGN